MLIWLMLTYQTSQNNLENDKENDFSSLHNRIEMIYIS